MVVDIEGVSQSEAQELLRTRLFPVLLTDTASVHAVLLLATTMYGHTHGAVSHRIDLLQLRGMAIREINRALEDATRATTDQIIAAVGLMACYEVLFGDQDIFNTHMTGLLRLVTLRGGLPRLGLNGLLERVLLYIDANATQLIRQRVYFDPDAFPATARHPVPDLQRFTRGSAGLSR
jgi:hypothetical protein